MLTTWPNGGLVRDDWPALLHNEKCRIAQELGTFYRQLLETRSNMAGRPPPLHPGDAVRPPREKNVRLRYGRPHNYFTKPHLYKPYEDTRTTTTAATLDSDSSVLSLIQTHLKWQLAVQKRVHPFHDCMEDQCYETQRTVILKSLQTVAESVAKDGWLDDVTVEYGLDHGYIGPETIYFNTSAPEGGCHALTITNWDYARFLPSYMICHPPQWLWDESQDFQPPAEWPFDRYRPDTYENQTIKRLFDEAAGPSAADLRIRETLLNEWISMKTEARGREGL
ncbi:hypothetical protein B0H63DRAFT_445424 [Podospora didyma]|uniref:Uncharacterized protein n=1 Tax=Podospora didyma TaxID=330526 RepID=A0AAE0U382_9PEZI|nr:hypothetical protein B0H63DRAFT_445424 [Podospora didyma]